MQFPNINKYQSSISKHSKHTHDGLLPIKYDSSPLERQNFQQILSNIDQINLARSFPISTAHQHENTMASSKGTSNLSSKQTHSKEVNVIQFQEGVRSIPQRKSLIYAAKDINIGQAPEQMLKKQIKIYYFNLPTYKIFNYDQNTTISNIISQAILAYIADKRLNSNKIQDKSFKNYQLRLLQEEQNHQADLSIQPLSYDRFLIDNLFDSLVLLEKNVQKKKSKTNQYLKMIKKSSFVKDVFINIMLFNEHGQMICEIKMNNEDSLQKVYEYIQQHDLHQMKSFYLTQNKVDNYILPRDFQLKNLQSNKLYIKLKRFIDESNVQAQKKSLQNNIHRYRQSQQMQNFPISLKEASQYQQFTVIKVNKLGFEQQRIIGIDQDKIYNYSREVKEEKKQTGFFSKLFGISEITGTKRPFRFIKDIKGITSTQKGFNLTYSDKIIKFYVKTNETKQRIIRKITFLVDLANTQQKVHLKK